MAEPADMILPLLQEMRAENKALHQAAAERIASIDNRLKKIEEAKVSYRQALSADTLMSKLITGEFEERIESLERKANALESLERRVRLLETGR